jgi:hypothetical protein
MHTGLVGQCCRETAPKCVCILHRCRRMQYTAPKKIMDDVPVEGDAAEQVCDGCAAAGC